MASQSQTQPTPSSGLAHENFPSNSLPPTSSPSVEQHEMSKSDEVEAARMALQEARDGGRMDVAAHILNVVGSLERQYKKMNVQLPDVEERTNLLREALQAVKGNDPLDQMCRLKIAKALEDRYHHTGQLADLDEAVSILRPLSTSLAPADVLYPSVITLLSTTLRERYAHVGKSQDLTDAIACLTPAGNPCANCGATVLPNVPAASSETPAAAPAIGCASCKAGIVGIAHTLARAPLTTEGDPCTDCDIAAPALQNLAFSLTPATTEGDPCTDCDISVPASRTSTSSVAPATTDGDPCTDCDIAAHQLSPPASTAVQALISTPGDPCTDCDIAAHQLSPPASASVQALLSTPGDPCTDCDQPPPPPSQSTDSISNGVGADAAEPNLSVSSANSSSTAAIAPFKISSAIYADALDALASALFFQKAGDVVVCVRLHELALATMPPCAGENDAILAGLGTSRRWAWTKTWERCYLDSSTEAYHAALNARPVGHRDRAASLNDLGLIYRLAFIETGSLDSLDLSVKSYTEGLAASPIPVMELQLHGNLALALICRYEATAVARDIEDAVAHAREAYKCPSGHRYRNTATEALAESLYKHHRLTGDMAEFEECVQLRRQQLRRIPPPTGSLRATAVNNLGTLLLARYGYIKDVADLDEAVALFREALELVSDRSVSQAHALFRLARSLKLIFEETGRVDNLEEAMAVQKNLMSHARLHGSSYGEFLSAAAETCLLRFSTLQDRDDLEEAITLYRRAIEEVTVTHLHTYQYFDGLAHSLRKRFSVTKALSDATEAMTTQNTALSLVAPGHPERARMLAHLAGIFILPSAPFYSMEIAAGYLLAGLEDGHRHPQLRLSEGIEVVQMLEAQCGPSVTVKYHIRILILTAYRAAISLLPQVACFGLDLRTRARVLTTSKDLATRAAAHALLISQPSTALEILEAGRAVFWTQHLKLRTQFENLPSAMAEKLAALSRRLEESAFIPSNFKMPDETQARSQMERQLAERRQLSEEFEGAIEEARRLPGFERLLMNEGYLALKMAAEKGPVIVFIASGHVCQAIVLPNPAAEAIQVALETTEDRLRTLSDFIKHATAAARSAVDETDVELASPDSERGMMLVHASERRFPSEVEVLAELWRTVMQPVIRALGLQKTTGRARPRAWIVNTGITSFLPLHAAGVYGDNSSVDSCSDYAVMSSTPTLSALIQARQSIKSVGREAKALLAAVAHPYRYSVLRWCNEEVQGIKTVIPPAAVLDFPSHAALDADVGDGASVQDVLDALPYASIVHLACHGRQNPNNALASGFVMRDGLLTVQDLVRLKLPHAFFAFLSACETAKGDRNHPDQAIHLAACMLALGFQSVIGTLWSMGDIDGPLVANHVYRELFNGEGDLLDPETIPYALDAAVAALRASGLSPARWACYVHIGA